MKLVQKAEKWQQVMQAFSLILLRHCIQEAILTFKHFANVAKDFLHGADLSPCLMNRLSGHPHLIRAALVCLSAAIIFTDFSVY